MQLYPACFLKLGKRTRIQTHGYAREPVQEPSFHLIHPGGLDDYFCKTVDPKAVDQLEAQDLFVHDGEHRWKLK